MENTKPEEGETWKVINEENDHDQYIVVRVLGVSEETGNVQCRVEDTSEDETSIYREGQVTEITENFFYEEK